jgi:hypothetical protein
MSEELGNGCGDLIEILTRYLRGGSEEGHKRNLSGYPVFRLRFETYISRIKYRILPPYQPLILNFKNVGSVFSVKICPSLHLCLISLPIFYASTDVV